MAKVEMAPGAPPTMIATASIPTSPSKEGFYRYFQQEVTSLQEQIGHLQNLGLVGGERQDAIDHCLAGIARLTNEVSDASDYVPAYDQRTYAQAVKALSERLQETREKVVPKPKFSFKRTHKNGSAISLTDAAELVAQQRLQPPSSNTPLISSNESSIATTPAHLKTPPSERADNLSDLPAFPPQKDYDIEIHTQKGAGVRKPSFSQSTSIRISGHDNLHIILPSSAARATSSGQLTRLNGCIVDMSVPTTNGAPFAGLNIKNIKSSLIVAGQVAGAAHITEVKNSVIVVASRQVRMHECKNVDVYLLCSSRPIIEDCSGVRFAPLPEHYMPVGDVPAVQNQWDQVDDFKWLKAEHSPNWSILPEEQRVAEDIWTGVVPGGPAHSVDGILRKVGVQI